MRLKDIDLYLGDDFADMWERYFAESLARGADWEMWLALKCTVADEEARKARERRALLHGA